MTGKTTFLAAASLLLAAALGGCESTGEPVSFQEPIDLSYGGLMPGSTVNWMEVGGGYDSRFMNIVVARGPDFTIFFDPDYAEFALEDEDPSAAYGVEYSGIVYYACDEDTLPDAAQREAIAGLRDMSKGEVLDLPGLEMSIMVGKESQSNINGLGDVTLRRYTVNWGGEEAAESETVSVAEEYDVTVKVEWAEGPPSVVVGVAQTETAKPLSLHHASALGNCAALVE